MISADTDPTPIACRVLLVSPSPPPYGGMALQGRQLEKRLTGDGIQVAFFASNFPLPESLGFCERLPGVRTLLRACGIWFRLLPAVRRTDIVHVLAASWVYFFMVVYPAVIIGRLCGKRVVVNYRGGEAREFFRQYGWLAGPVFQLASVITAPSEFLAGVIRSRFGVDVAIVPNILDTSAFRYRERTEFRPKLLVTRHLEEIYDVETILRAFRVLQERYPEATLSIAGSGSLEPHLRKLAVEWKLSGVSFLGYVPHPNLPAIYDQCDIYVNASRVDNFPGALLEASAAGLAVVSTDAGGIPAIYKHQKTALLLEPGDWQGLADAVQNVLNSQPQALTMTKAALAVARACDWREVRKSLYRSYGLVDMTLVGPRPDAEGAPCGAG